MGLFRKKKMRKEAVLLKPAVAENVYREKKSAFAEADRRNPYDGKQWIFCGLAISLACAIVVSCLYGVFRANAEKNMSSPIENADNISWLYQNCYLLYRDLYNAQNKEQLNYFELFLETPEEHQWLLDPNKVRSYQGLLEEGEENQTEASSVEVSEGVGEEERVNERTVTYEEITKVSKVLENLERYFQKLEEYFRNLNNSYDYMIQDNLTGKYITNMSTNDINRGAASQYFLLQFTFDGAGNVTIGDTICGVDETQIRKFANEALRENAVFDSVDGVSRLLRVKTPVNCTVTFAISREVWAKVSGGADFGTWGGYLVMEGYNSYYQNFNYGGTAFNAYKNSGTEGVLILCLFGMLLLGFLLPIPGRGKPWRDVKICSLPLEILLVIGLLVCVLEESVVTMVAYVAGGRAYNAVKEYLALSGGKSEILVGAFNLLMLTLFFFCAWYLGVCARAVKGMGVKGYIKQRSLIYRFFPFVKSRAMRFYEAMLHLDLTQNAKKTILKLVLVNALILFFISSLWFGGLAVTVVYSFFLYLILRKYVSDLQEKYRVLFKAVDEIADGNLNVTINEDLGVFEPFRLQIFKIQDGLKKAVTMEVKSQRIKTELVTNMSHDLKTPLTAIITYVNLLKKGDVTEVQRKEYLAILERKSLRLKSLIDDLFEFSKANSQNVTLNIMDVDIMNLVKQVAFEMSDKISEARLDVRLNLTEEKVILPLDSQKTYRIYENLFGNIAKYALTGTRVYVNGFRIDDTVVITLKNISAQEITVEASELTERFVRNNTSRNTEGSGLGLAIAKSFMELQGGTLELEVDGDLFKVTTTWHVKEKDEK